MKKMLIFILLLITTAGAFIPCCHIDDCCAKQIANTPGDKSQKREETCPPFFVCTTCSVIAELTNPTGLIQPIIEKPVYQESAVVFYFSPYSGSYWQPPRSC
jgi:hypothetical protein